APQPITSVPVEDTSMNPRFFALAALLAAATGLVIGCGGNKPPSGDKPNTNIPGAAHESEAKPPEITSVLYPKAPDKTYKTTVARKEPIIIGQALVSYEDRQVISAEVDGTLELMATPISKDESDKLGIKLHHPRDPKPEGQKTYL